MRLNQRMNHGGAVASGAIGFARQPTACRIARIHLLGPMRATSYLGDNILPRGRKARALLACLCLAAGAEVPRVELARLLWDQARDDLALGSLRRALHKLCSAMGPLAEELISAGGGAIRLNADTCWIDALALIECSSPDLAPFCSGQLLEGLDGVTASFDSWLTRERDSFEHETRGFSRSQPASGWPDDKRDGPSRSPALAAREPLPARNRPRVGYCHSKRLVKAGTPKDGRAWRSR